MEATEPNFQWVPGIKRPKRETEPNKDIAPTERTIML